MERLKDLSAREKIVLSVGVIIIFSLLYLGLFLVPAKKELSRLRKELKTKNKNWRELQALVQEYNSLPTVGAPAERVSLLAFLERSGGSLQIGNKIVYLRPTSAPNKGEGAEIKLDNITGEELLRFLHSIQGAQIQVVSINLRDPDLDGLWTVKMFLEG